MTKPLDTTSSNRRFVIRPYESKGIHFQWGWRVVCLTWHWWRWGRWSCWYDGVHNSYSFGFVTIYWNWGAVVDVGGIDD